MEAVWGLLCHIMLAYPNLCYPNLCSTAPKIVFKDLPYRPDERQELEESLLAFIFSRGVLDRTWVPGTTSRFSVGGATMRFSEKDY